MLILRLLHFLSLSLAAAAGTGEGNLYCTNLFKGRAASSFQKGALEIKTARVYFAKKKWQDKHRVRDYCTEIS